MCVFTILILYIIGLVSAGIILVKHLDQRSRDRQRKTYRLSFPSDLKTEQVVAWIRAISGSMRRGSTRFVGAPTIAFEMYATEQGIVHLLRVPWVHADFVINQLRSMAHGINASPEKDYEHQRKWTRVVEVGLTQSTRQLRIYSPPDVAASLLASVQPLEAGEALLVQWVVAPAVPTHPPVQNETTSDQLRASVLTSGNMANADEIRDRRDKLAEPNVVGVLRVAAAADTVPRADHLIYRVRSALAATRSPATRFYKRVVTKAALQDRIDRAAGSVVFPVQLSAPELSALVAWPVGNPFIPGLAPTMTRHMPPVASIPQVGRVIGTSTFPGSERVIAVGYDHALRHMHVLGPTGTGKSTLLANMMAQDMQNGHGIILIEGKGDLFEATLDRIPDNRIEDVIIIDVNDTARPVGFNILDQGSSRSSIDELCALVASMYKESSASLHAPQVLYHMLHALSEVPGHTFIDLPALLTNHPNGTPEGEWQDWLSREIRNKDIRAFVQRYLNLSPTERDRMSGPVYNRTWEFTSRPEMKYIMGQRTSSFKMVDAIRDNKIVLVNLNGIRVGQKTAALAGTMIVNAVWQAVRTVTAQKPNFLYLDEFQDFAELPVGLEAMLAKARSSQLGAVLAHQHSGQLRPDLRSAVLANAVTKVVFQTTSDDARLMAREFGRQITDADFLNLGRYQAIARISTDAGVSTPVTIATKPPSPWTGNAKKARQYSRLRYGRPIEDVEKDIEARQAIAKPEGQRRRPRVSGEGWGV